MITGSISFENLTDNQLTQVMEAKDKHEGKLLFQPGGIRTVTMPLQTLNDNVVVSWNEEEGFRATLELCHTLLGETATVTKIA